MSSPWTAARCTPSWRERIRGRLPHAPTACRSRGTSASRVGGLLQGHVRQRAAPRPQRDLRAAATYPLADPRRAPACRVLPATRSTAASSACRCPKGTLCAWLPLPESDESGAIDAARARKRMDGARGRPTASCCAGLSCSAVLALPAALSRTSSMGPRRISPLRSILGSPRGSPSSFAAGFARSALGWRGDTGRGSWLLFVDSAGVLRVADSLHAGKRTRRCARALGRSLPQPLSSGPGEEPRGTFEL